MSRRLQALALIALLLAGPLLNVAAGQAGRVRVLVASVEQAESLISALRRAGGRARVISTDRGAWLEITAADMGSAIRALRAAAEAQDIDVKIPARHDGERLVATAGGCDVSPRTRRPSPPAAAPASTSAGPEISKSHSPNTLAAPPPKALDELPALSLRGPPA